MIFFEQNKNGKVRNVYFGDGNYFSNNLKVSNNGDEITFTLDVYEGTYDANVVKPYITPQETFFKEALWNRVKGIAAEHILNFETFRKGVDYGFTTSDVYDVFKFFEVISADYETGERGEKRIAITYIVRGDKQGGERRYSISYDDIGGVFYNGKAVSTEVYIKKIPIGKMIVVLINLLFDEYKRISGNSFFLPIDKDPRDKKDLTYYKRLHSKLEEVMFYYGDKNIKNEHIKLTNTYFYTIVEVKKDYYDYHFLVKGRNNKDYIYKEIRDYLYYRIVEKNEEVADYVIDCLLSRIEGKDEIVEEKHKINWESKK